MSIRPLLCIIGSIFYGAHGWAHMNVTKAAYFKQDLIGMEMLQSSELNLLEESAYTLYDDESNLKFTFHGNHVASKITSLRHP